MGSEGVISAIFEAELWQPVDDFHFEDITYHRARDVGAVRIAFNRPEVRNAFRPRTVDELFTALEHARTTSDVGAVIVTGNGPWEQPRSTYQLSGILSRKGIRHHLDDWGPEGGHDWPYWKNQMREYLSRW